jgi:hypothetical protein
VHGIQINTVFGKYCQPIKNQDASENDIETRRRIRSAKHEDLGN